MNQTDETRFRAWLAEHAERRAPAVLLERAMADVDATPQDRGWTLRWPMLRFALPATAAVAVLLIAVTALLVLNNVSEPVGPPATSTPSTQASSSATETASAVPSAKVTPAPATQDAQVVARVPLPEPGGQLPFDEAIAVTDSTIWTTGSRGEHLVRIDTGTNAVTLDRPIDSAVLVAGDGRLYALGPYGLVPGPASMDLSLIDQATGETSVLAQVPTNQLATVGLGGIWVRDTQLTLLDPETGALLRTLPVATSYGVDVACGALWSWTTGPAPDQGSTFWLLQRLDPETGAVLLEVNLPGMLDQHLVDANGACFAVSRDSDRATLYRIDPQQGLTRTVELTTDIQVSGGTFWTWTPDGIVQQIDPATANPIGSAWQLPSEDLRVTAKGTADWRLLVADGSLWLAAGDEFVRYDIAVP